MTVIDPLITAAATTSTAERDAYRAELVRRDIDLFMEERALVRASETPSENQRANVEATLAEVRARRGDVAESLEALRAPELPA